MRYPTMVPYLAVSNAAEAIAYYRAAFGAEERMRAPAPDGRRMMHAEIAIRDGLVMLADAYPEGGFPAPTGTDPVPVGLMLACPSPAEVDATFRRAVEAGGRPETEPMDATWGSRFAAIVDPFGHRWWLHAPLDTDA